MKDFFEALGELVSDVWHVISENMGLVAVILSTFSLLLLCWAVSIRDNPPLRDPESKISYRVHVIDGCQYVSTTDSMSHKGNCTNSIHVYSNR
jgi:hypothetical protein